MKKSTIIASGAVIAGAALMAGGIMSGELGINVNESDQVAIPQEEITQYRAELPQCIGLLATNRSIKLDAKGGVHASIPFTDLHPGFDWKDEYSATVPADFEFCMKSVADVVTTRKNTTSPPLATDTANVHINRSELFANRPRVNASKEADIFIVKNHHIVKRNGQPLIPSEPIFAGDGRYSSGSFRVDGDKKGMMSRFVQKLSFDNVDIGEDAATDLVAIGQVEAFNPRCITRAWREVDPDQLAIEAFKNGYVTLGFAKNNVHVSFTGEWPEAKAIPDETGNTYAQNRHELNKELRHVPEKYSVAARCDASAVENPTPGHH